MLYAYEVWVVKSERIRTVSIFIVKTAMIKKPRQHNTGARLESNDREGLFGILGQVIRDRM